MTPSLYVFLFTFLAAILLIMHYRKAKSNSSETPELSYTKFDLEKCDSDLLTNTQFKDEMDHLIQNGYHLTSKKEVFDFVYHHAKLSEKSVVIIMDDKASAKVRSILPLLLKRNVNVIFFIPLIFTI